MIREYTVRIAFLDVGQGDTIVVSIPETQEAIVIDCMNANLVLHYLEQQNIKHLQGLIITHLHLDHYRDVVKLLNNCEEQLNIKCKAVFFNWPRIPKSDIDKLLNDYDNHSDVSDNPGENKRLRLRTWGKLRKWAQTNKDLCDDLSVKRGNSRLQIEGILAEVVELLHPQYTDLNDLLLNDSSAVLKVSGAGSSALLTGDLEHRGWQKLSENVVDLQCDLLKFPHHGAWRNADPRILLNEVNPSLVVISVGTSGIKYQHPNPTVLQTIAKRSQTRLLCTQVTKLCAENIPKREVVRQQFDDTSNFFSSTTGCPCAGTIVVELGQSAQLIQPKATLHHQIISNYFSQSRCM
ncbi:hypothetical protein QUF64_04605 [Anaerolineales bacterium HSG6]|nr:hypothetical protein [Anaerolineales bacterium HSG6]